MSNTSRIPKTEDQLIDAFHEQLDFICEACKLYDSGKPSRIKMAAPHLRTLFYHQRRGTILIELVDVDKKSFISYAPENINLMDMYTGPIFIDTIKRPPHTKPVPVYFPICYEEPPFGKKCDYDIWWEEPILKHFNTSFSRKNIVDYIANQDGGAHVDPGLKSQYVDLINGAFSFQVSLVENQKEFAESIQLALLRQIAHETIETFISQGIPNIEYENGSNSSFNNSRVHTFSPTEMQFRWLD